MKIKSMKSLFLTFTILISLTFLSFAQEEVQKTDNAPNTTTAIIRLTHGSPVNVNVSQLFTPIFPMESIVQDGANVWNRIQLTGPKAKDF
jgi:hypothetical protein